MGSYTRSLWATPLRPELVRICGRRRYRYGRKATKTNRDDQVPHGILLKKGLNCLVYLIL